MENNRLSYESQIASENLKFTTQIKNDTKASTNAINKLEKELKQLRVDWNTYIPKKGDNIDEKVARFVNTYPEKE